ncbi:MAG: hypothetical protein LV480_12685, partial [Methylacidiphilales bacterium]|nr:hypothetical protein [Candidatus Methylacidiphilales bacterium]
MKSFTNKFKKAFGGLVAAMLCMLSISAAHAQLILNFTANTGSTIQFNGSLYSFQFNPGSVTPANPGGYQWNITSESGGTGAAVGLNGSFLGGPFSYGAITSSDGGQIQSATVTGPLSTLTIYDGAASLTGTVDFMTVTTIFQSIGALNGELNVNLTNVSYTGTNADLQTLTAYQPGTLDVSFQFASPTTLTSLSTGSTPTLTSYSGSIIETPEPSTWALMLYGLGLL